MILPFTAPIIEHNTLPNQAQRMRANMSGKMFQILSGSLYAHKIRAIIRELSTNAWDAHQDARTAHLPFEVQLPTRISPIFRIRDFGTGMSEDTVFRIYNCLFESTKTDTNEQAGMLGLGSKTPFAYTSSVIVTSYQNGYKKIYNSLMGDDGVPAITKVMEQETTEPDGLEVQFAVSPEDCWKFETEARLVYTVFLDGAKPKVLNTDLKDYDPSENLTKVSDNLYFSANSLGHASHNIIQGNVCYPLSISKLPVESKKYLEAVDGISHWYIKVPIGTVDFQPSREGLDESEKNYEKLVPHLKDFQEYLLKFFREKYGHFKHEMEATSFYLSNNQRYSSTRGFSKNYFDIILKEIGIKYRENGVYETDDITELLDTLGVEIERSKGDNGGYRQGPRADIGQRYTGPEKDRFTPELPPALNTFSSHLKIYHVNKAINNVQIVVVDDVTAYRKRIRHHYGKSSSYCRIVLTKSAENDKATETFLALFPLLKVVKTSEMAEPPSVARGTAAPRVLQRWFCDPCGYQPMQAKDWETLADLKVDDQRPFYYAVVKSKEDWLDGVDFNRNDLGEVLHQLKEFGIIEDPKQFVVIRGSKVEQVSALANARNLVTHVRDYFKANVTEDAFIDYINRSMSKNKDYILDRLLEFFGKFDEDELETLDFGTECKELIKNYKHNIYDRVAIYFKVRHYVYPNLKVEYIEPTYKNIIKDIETRYPLMNAMLLRGSLLPYTTNLKKLLKKEITENE